MTAKLETTEYLQGHNVHKIFLKWGSKIQRYRLERNRIANREFYVEFTLGELTDYYPDQMR